MLTWRILPLTLLLFVTACLHTGKEVQHPLRIELDNPEGLVLKERLKFTIASYGPGDEQGATKLDWSYSADSDEIPRVLKFLIKDEALVDIRRGDYFVNFWRTGGGKPDLGLSPAQGSPMDGYLRYVVVSALGGNYGKAGNKIYRRQPSLYQEMPEVDAASFRYLGLFYATDKKQVYCEGLVLRNADPKSFEVLSNNNEGKTAKDRNQAYHDCRPWIERDAQEARSPSPSMQISPK